MSSSGRTQERGWCQMGTANSNDQWGRDDERERSGQWPNEAIGTGKHWGMRACLVLWPLVNCYHIGIQSRWGLIVCFFFFKRSQQSRFLKSDVPPLMKHYMVHTHLRSWYRPVCDLWASLLPGFQVTHPWRMLKKAPTNLQSREKVD